MNNKNESYFKNMKLSNHNVYDIPTIFYRIAYSIVISIWIILLLDVMIKDIPPVTRLIILSVVFLFSAAIAFFSGKFPKSKIIPYTRQKNFQFLGLFNLKGTALTGSRDVISREADADYVNDILEKTILPQILLKQALCITGPSGCGKSTILAFFEQNYENEYKIYNFAGNYHIFDTYLESLFGSDIKNNIKKISDQHKLVFILDQFERFFFLSAEEQQKTRSYIQQLCMKNTAVIISLREEYLADFMKQFDMNNLLTLKTNKVEKTGILREMVSVIEKHPIRKELIGINNTSIWNENRIKNFTGIHMISATKQIDDSILDQVGAALLYCRNQNETTKRIGDDISESSQLSGNLINCLGNENGLSLFEKHANEPLIQQEIVYHMAEFNKEILYYSNEEMDAFIQKNNNELFEHYFDTQLACCPSFFHASRILYLLSQARLHQVSIKTEDIRNCLFPGLFERDGDKNMMKNIEKLEELQLIRKNGSTLEYEIAHDFISSVYIAYCSTNMNRGVKSALDLFISEFVNEKRQADFKEKIAFRLRAFKDRFYYITSLITACFLILIYLIQRFVYNPWTTVWMDSNPYGSYLSVFPLFITLISLLYLYVMFDKTVKYYRGRKQKACKIYYVLFSIAATSAVGFYPHFLFILGVDLALATLHIALLLDNEYKQSCQKELNAYGIKSFFVGIAFAAAHVLFFLFNPYFEKFLILTEFFMFTVLVAYAYIAHMHQEYMFARMTDTSSEKV